jgi:hypothetical protein
MKVTYDKEPRCYMCRRTDEEINHFLLKDQKDLHKALEKAQKARKKHIKKIRESNKDLYEKHKGLAKKKPDNYEFTMEVIKKDFNAFEKMITDLKEIVDAFDKCDQLNLESKVIEVIKVHKEYYNEDQLAADDKEIRRVEYELNLLDNIKLKFQTISTKLEYLSNIKAFDIKGTTYENMVISVNICPNCEKLIGKFS